MCVGSDGSIYAPSSGRIIRLEPTHGHKFDSTDVLANPELFQLRVSASANGVIYATTGENNIYAYTLDLQDLWFDNIPNVNTSGVAIGLNGLIAVAGANKIKVYTAGNLVPVELTSFTAEANKNNVILKWSTSTELNNNGFEVQRKFEENDYLTIGFVKGEGTTIDPKEYYYIDEDLANGKYDYRLKQIDYNGRYEYSDEVEVEVVNVNEFDLSQNYPNPFNPSTEIEFSLPEDVSNVKLSIYNALGEKVAELVNTGLIAGKYDYQWNAKNVAAGMYIYELRTDEFVAVKKMVLMK
jgi:hypothetical protein